MWMLIIATLAVAFASGLSLGSSLERGHWESAIKDQLNKLNARRARRAGRVRARRARRPQFAAASGFALARSRVKQNTDRPRAVNAA
jgi:hypothetical protein